MSNLFIGKKWLTAGCFMTAACAFFTPHAQASPVGAILQLQSTNSNNVVAASSNVPIYLYGVDLGPSPMTDEQIYVASSNPAINSIDLVTGTVFASNFSAGSYVTGSLDATDIAGEIDTNSGTVSDNGLLATIYVDTTGLAGQQFTLELTGVDPADGPFDSLLDDAGTPISISGDGVDSPFTFNVAAVPEPATLTVLGLSACGLLIRRRRRA